MLLARRGRGGEEREGERRERGRGVRRKRVLLGFPVNQNWTAKPDKGDIGKNGNRL